MSDNFKSIQEFDLKLELIVSFKKNIRQEFVIKCSKFSKIPDRSKSTNRI